MRALAFLLLTLVTFNRGNTENPCNIMTPQDTGQWGIGVIWFSPNAKASVYDRPSGNKIGTITKDEYGRVAFQQSSGLRISISENDFVWAGSTSAPLIKAYDARSSFLKILTQSTTTELWINFTGNENDIQFLTYRTLLLKPEKGMRTEIRDLILGANIGVNLTGTCLNLRKEDNTSSDIIECIAGNNIGRFGHRHLKILEAKDDWVKVEVIKYAYDAAHDESGEGCSFKEVKRDVGWIKLIDTDGHPNIWYSITSY